MLRHAPAGPACHLAGRALRALELIAAQPLSAPQIAGALGVAPRTARHLMTRLCEDGWVARSGDRVAVYSPTLRVAPLAALVVERHEVSATAAPHVAAVCAALEAPAHLMMPSAGGALCIVHDDGDGPRAGAFELAPWQASAAGTVLLAWSDGWREHVLRGTRAAIEPRPILERAAQARLRGYEAEEGRREGRCTVAAPVLDRGGEARWALSAAVPAGGSPHAAGRYVAEHAAELGARLAAAGRR